MELKNTAVTIGLTQKERDELERQINEHDMIACSNELTPAQYKSEKLRRDRDAFFCGRGNFLDLF